MLAGVRFLALGVVLDEKAAPEEGFAHTICGSVGVLITN